MVVCEYMYLPIPGPYNFLSKDDSGCVSIYRVDKSLGFEEIIKVPFVKWKPLHYRKGDGILSCYQVTDEVIDGKKDEDNLDLDYVDGYIFSNPKKEIKKEQIMSITKVRYIMDDEEDQEDEELLRQEIN